MDKNGSDTIVPPPKKRQVLAMSTCAKTHQPNKKKK